MGKKFFIGVFVVVLGIIGIVLVLASKHALLVHPKGLIARSELALILTNLILMSLIILPTYILLFMVVWKYCIKKVTSNAHQNKGVLSELLMWGLPSLVVVIMGIITWEATHRLNPYKPIASKKESLLIQVVALDWKWLFIYPKQGIASLNTLHIPEQTPIHFMLTADGSPMNSFWIPQLSGQIYSMTGMSTQLYLIADGPGHYVGRAVEINGEGYADMTFSVTSSSTSDFENWVAEAKDSPSHLTDAVYSDLARPYINRSVLLFSEVENDLYHKIINKYM